MECCSPHWRVRASCWNFDKVLRGLMTVMHRSPRVRSAFADWIVRFRSWLWFLQQIGQIRKPLGLMGPGRQIQNNLSSAFQIGEDIMTFSYHPQNIFCDLGNWVACRMKVQSLWGSEPSNGSGSQSLGFGAVVAFKTLLWLSVIGCFRFSQVGSWVPSSKCCWHDWQRCGDE